ncbi:MAG TPA: PLP-dependent aminotransferase family protein, partial [Stenotrophomonas sp.]
VDLSMNIPPLLGSSPFAQSMERGFQQLSQQLGQGELMSYHVGAGSRDDRAAAVQWLAPILGSVSAERVVICPGAQAALCAIVLAKTQPGDLIAAEQLTYPGLLAAARVLQRGIVSIAMDAEGMLPDALEAACQQRKPALIYLIPTIQNPTTATMSQARRAAILAIARRHGVAVVEDDPYWLLAADAAPPLAVDSHPDAPVYYVSTLSKCLAPGLRTAYLVVPPGEPMEPLLDALRSIALMPTQSMVAVASHWIRSGQADEMVRRFQQELRQRQQIAARILPKPYQAHSSGLHVWLPLPPRLDQYRLIQAAQAQGLGIASSEAFSIEEQAGNAIRLSLGGAVDQHSLAAALTKLTEVISAAPETRTQAIV